jgi:hydrogenase expression/formation protein HypC
MCIGVPMQLVETAGPTACWCVGRQGRQLIDLSLAAREVMEPDAAARTDAALDALEAVLAGDASGVDEAFADLIAREPQLPAHLRPPEN